MHRIWAARPPEAEALAAALEAFTAALPPRRSERDEETVEALRALGYVE